MCPFLVPSAGAMGQAITLGSLGQWARPSTVLSRAEKRLAIAAAEASWTFLRRRAVCLVEECGQQPLLMHYGSDGTPVSLHQWQAAAGPGPRPRRGAGLASHELLVQRGMLHCQLPSGEVKFLALCRSPQPLEKGKTTWHLFQAMVEFFPLPRALGHRGLLVTHYVWDRAIQPSMSKRAFQRQSLFYASKVQGGENIGEWRLFELLDWQLSTGCACHDAHNALRWAVLPWAGEKLKAFGHLHTTVHGLRHGQHCLHATLHSWLLAHLAFWQEAPEEQELYVLWTALGCLPELAAELADLHVLWRDNFLWAHPRHEGHADLLPRLSQVLLLVLRWKPFTDSRWLTMGETSRALTTACLLGLESLLAAARADPALSDFWLQSTEAFDAEAKHLAFLTALASWVPDTFMASILQDDRLALYWQQLRQDCKEEIQYLEQLPPQLWEICSMALPDTSAELFRSNCLQAGHVAASYLEDRVFKETADWPWCLCSDFPSREEGLQTLAQMEFQDHWGPTTGKLWNLLNNGYPQHILLKGVELLAQTRWSTLVVEQGHGSSSALHKAQRTAGLDVLTARSMLHMLWPLLPSPAGTEEGRKGAASALEERERRLLKRSPHKVSGRQLFFKDMVAEALARAGGVGQLSQPAMRDIMAKHSQLYSQLGQESKDNYEAMAATERTLKQHQLREDFLGLLEEKLHLEAGQQLERHSQQQLLALANCKLTGQEVQQLLQEANALAGSRATLEKTRVDFLSGPGVPALAAQNALMGQGMLEPEDLAPRPEWLGSLCKQRDRAANVALGWQREGQASPRTAFAFLWASQKPYKVWFLELEGTSPLPALPAPARGGEEQPLWQLGRGFGQLHFQSTGRYLQHNDLPRTAEGLLVLPGLLWLPSSSFSSYFSWMKWEAVFEPWKPARQREPRERREPRGALEPGLVERFPWVQKFLDEQQKGRERSRPHGQGQPSAPREPVEPEALDQDAYEEIFQALENKRQHWAEENLSPQEHFRTSMLGGPWTKEHLGCLTDSIKASAAGKEAKEWCRGKGLPIQATFSLRKFGELHCSHLALYWCALMQYLMDRDLGRQEQHEVAAGAGEVPWEEPGHLMAVLSVAPEAVQERLQQLRELLRAGA